MHVLGITGPSGSGKRELLERVSERLGERGRVATVEHLETGPNLDTDGRDPGRDTDGTGSTRDIDGRGAARNADETDPAGRRTAGADATYGIGDESGWVASGRDRTLDETLEDLAPDYDYALVEGFSDARIPTVALGGREHAGETLATASDADAVDVESLVEALEEREPFETLGSLVADAKDAPGAEYAGAIATFTGRVRERDGPDDPPTERLEFEKYDGVAAQRMATIREELEARDGVQTVRLHHRTGVVEAGEDIVFVVVLAGHRTEAFRTVEDGIDRLKDEVPLFKKEVTVDDAFWAHERQQ